MILSPPEIIPPPPLYEKPMASMEVCPLNELLENVATFLEKGAHHNARHATSTFVPVPCMSVLRYAAWNGVEMAGGRGEGVWNPKVCVLKWHESINFPSVNFTCSHQGWI